MDNVSKKIRARYGLTCSQLPPQAPGFENWNYTVENVDGALQVRDDKTQRNDDGDDKTQ